MAGTMRHRTWKTGEGVGQDRVACGQLPPELAAPLQDVCDRMAADQGLAGDRYEGQTAVPVRC